jgi:hypothetical protein
VDPEGAAAAAIAQYDANNDSVIASAELDKCPALKAALPRIDTDKDGRISATEIAARVRKYESDRVGLVPVTVTVSMDRKPLGGAVVTLQPEEFLGSDVKPAQCTTNDGGFGVFETEGAGAPGVQCSLFRVIVSKKDPSGKEIVPARYNQESTLGVETGYDSPTIRNSLDLELKTR